VLQPVLRLCGNIPDMYNSEKFVKCENVREIDFGYE
jgi:hypothetical protein